MTGSLGYLGWKSAPPDLSRRVGLVSCGQRLPGTPQQLTNAIITSSEIDGANNVETQSLTLTYETIAVQGA
jgi:hypothetical protein